MKLTKQQIQKAADNKCTPLNEVTNYYGEVFLYYEHSPGVMYWFCDDTGNGLFGGVENFSMNTYEVKTGIKKMYQMERSTAKAAGDVPG